MIRGVPRLACGLLRLILPRDERNYVLGDLDEQFARREREGGRTRAVRWYWGEVMRSAWPIVTYPGRWRGKAMVGIIQDLRGAFRVFQREPWFVAVVVLTLGLGVGGASAVYSVVRGVLVTPLPFEDPDRVVMLWGMSAEYPRAPLTVGDHNVLAREVDSFEKVAGAWSDDALILGDGAAEQVSVAWVTPEYFDVLGVAPVIGRGLEPLEGRAILLSHGLWERRYGSDPGVIGSTIDLSGDLLEIVGILPRDRDPNLTTFAGGRSHHQVWRLQPPEWTQGDDRSVGWLRSTARLTDGVSLAQAQQEVGALMARVNETVTFRDGGSDLTVRLITAKADLVGDVSRTLWILLAAVVGVLLIAASNVAQLLLARGETRGEEVAVRSALGGSRSRLIRQLVVESGVLAAAGGLLGISLAAVGVKVLLRLAPPSLPRLDAVALDWSVLWFALGATVLAALVFAIVPAIRTTRTDLSKAMSDRTATADPTRQRLSRGLVVAEVAMTLALMTSPGLLLRSSSGLHAEELGFQKEGVITFALEAPGWGIDGKEAAATMTAYLDAITGIPGVLATGITNRVPLGGGLFTGAFRSEEMAAANVEAVRTSVRYVTPDYFEAMGARLVMGRTFLPEEGVDRVLLDEIATEHAWPGENPIGRRVEITTNGVEPVFAEVVGVVAPMKHEGVRQEAAQTVFLPMLAVANQQNSRYVAARVAGAPSDISVTVSH